MDQSTYTVKELRGRRAKLIYTVDKVCPTKIKLKSWMTDVFSFAYTIFFPPAEIDLTLEKT